MIADDLLQRPDFVAEYEPAKAELRRALGYSGS